MGLCSSRLVSVGGGLFFGSPRGRERGGARSVTTSTNFIPGQPTTFKGMGGLVVRAERMEEAERARVEGGAMSVSCTGMRLAQ